MKKFLIGFMCVLLFSCHPVTSPAYADVVEQESIIFPISSEKQEYNLCLDIVEFSFNAMLLRQSGVSEEEALSLAPTPTNEYEAMLKVLLDAIVNDVYVFPVYESKEDKLEISKRFANVIYSKCIGE